MTIERLALTPVVETLAGLTPAVMYERTAARYVMLGIHDFRMLVNKGVIVYRTHPGRTRRIYLKVDLDDYLRNLPRSNIAAGRVHPGPGEKGDQGGRS